MTLLRITGLLLCALAIGCSDTTKTSGVYCDGKCSRLGTVKCGGTCSDLEEATHCGSCTNACKAGEICNAGTCAPGSGGGGG